MTDDVTLDLLLNVPDHPTLDSAVEQARTAEDLGFERVSLGETTDWNAVATLALIAERTDRIGISNDVFSPYSRSPGLLGQTAAAIQEASGGRYRLGLGASSPALVEQWHGAAFERPVEHLAETIDIVRAVLSGDRVSHDGECFHLDGLSMDTPAPAVETPIDLAALGPTTVELTGRKADGWVPQMFTPDGLRDRLDDLERGARAAGRRIDDIRVAPIVRCCALADRDRARDIARRYLAFFIGAYGPYYRRSIAQQGYEEAAAALREAWQSGDRDRMPDLVSDDLLDAVVAAGTPDEVRETLRAFAAVDGVDAIRVGFMMRQPLEDQYATMEAVTDG